MKKKLTDSSTMPYGKHRGKKMVDVPAAYLMYMYDNDKLCDSTREYVDNNLDVLQAEQQRLMRKAANSIKFDL